MRATIVLAVCLALVAASASAISFRRVHRDASRNVTGRVIPFKIVDGVRRSPCLDLASLSADEQRLCKNQMMMRIKHERVQKRVQKVLDATATTPAPQQTGFLVNAQWDGMTIPKVQWALDITRQSVLEYPFVPDEQQLQLLIPPRDGPANAPTFTAYDALSRNYFLTTRATDYTGFVFGVTVAGDVNSTQYTYPKQSFKFPHARALMVGMETVTLGGVQIVLVFYADGIVQQVDPTSGATTAFAQVCNATRLVSAVTYRKDTHDIFLLTSAPPGIGRRPDYGVITLNYETKATVEVLMQVPAFFSPLDESGFEMAWLNSVQNLMVCFTGLFDQIIYVNPYTGAATFMYGNLAEFQGSDATGQIEFTSDAFLEDLDTDANLAIDDGVGQTVYFQCSDVDKSTGLATTTLCSHEMPTDLTALTWLNINIEPMTYGYAGSEFVQIDS